MRTFNVRLAGIVVAVVVVFGIGVYFLHAYQVKRNANVFLEQAKRADKQADAAAKEDDQEGEQKARRDAINYRKWYVRLMPDNVDCMEELGLMMAKQSQVLGDGRMFGQAFGYLEQVLRLDPDRQDARRQVVKMAMLMASSMPGRWQDAREHLQVLLKKSPKDPELLELSSQCQMQLGNSEAAVNALKKAIQDKPSQLTSYEMLAALLRSPRLSKAQEADQWMEKLVAANPKSARAHYLRARYLMGTGSNENGLKEATKALELAPEDGDVLLLATTCYMMDSQYDKARELVNRAIKLEPRRAEMYRAKAEVEKRAGKSDAAIAALQQGLKATQRKANSPENAATSRQNAELQWTLANFLIDVDRLDEARQAVDALRQTKTAKEKADYVAARIEFAAGKWKAARDAFEAIRPAAIDPRGPLAGQRLVRQIDLWIGQCYAQLGNRGEEIRVYRRVLEIDPSFAPAREGLINALVATGQLDEAIQEYPVLASSAKLPASAVVKFAGLVLLKTMRQAPAARDFTAVEKALANAEKAAPNSAEVLLMRAEVLRARDRAADAERLLADAYAKDPKQPAYLNAAISSAERRSEWAQAEKLLGELKALVGDTPAYRLQQAMFLVRRDGKGAKTADGLRKLGEGDGNYSDEQRVQLWDGLAQLAMQAGDPKLADDLRRKTAAKQPNNAQVRFAMLERAIAAADVAAAEQAVNDLERVAGRDARWNYGKAMLLVLRAQAEKDTQKQKSSLLQSLEYLADAHSLQSDWSRIPLVAGDIYLAMGRRDKALAHYREAMEMGERNPLAALRLLQLLVQRREFVEADKWVRGFERELGGQLPPKLRQAAAEIALGLGDMNRATALARAGVSEDSKEYGEQLWLAQVLATIGQKAKADGEKKRAEDLFAEAQKAVRRAVELEPKLPNTWITLVQFLTTTGQPEKAEKAVEDARQKLPPKELHLALAQCYQAMGKSKLAEEEYKAAVAAAPENLNIVRAFADFYMKLPDVDAAEGQLQRILDGKLTTTKQDRSWARQQQAMVYLRRGGHQNFQKAQELARMETEEGEPSPMLKKLNAMIDASDPDPKVREKGRREMEEITRDQSGTPEDRYALAQIYLAANDWGKATAEFRGLVTSFDREPRYLIAYIAALLQHGETSSAEMYLDDRLDKLLPREFAPVAMRADLLLAKKTPASALDILNAFVDSPDAQPKQRGMRSRLVAEKLGQLASKLTAPDQKALAEQFSQRAKVLYAEYVKANPGQELPLATFLAKRGEIDKALDTLEPAWGQYGLEDVSRACSLVWDDGTKFSAKQAQRFGGILEAAAAKFKQPAVLMSLMAQVRIREERYADAETLYREILRKNSNDGVAMNNLGVLLALRGIKLDEALKLMNRAMEIEGRVSAMLDSRCSVYLAMNDADNALKDIQAALADAETSVRLFHLAQAYQLAGRTKEAREAMAKSLKMGITKEELQPLEIPAFEKLRQLAGKG
ncbi:MAG: tetratricopeptide repeat protein [Planctomycetaceae bacterium]|nr:tetratricopeptide repeat protein [Planctomycetaceae bacterium]